MDELLKAYAKKRAEEAGAPPELHPATRRLLQGEVARVYPNKATSPALPWYRSALLLWPRFAFAAGIMVLLGGTLWMLNHKPENPTLLALNDSTTSTPPAVSTAPAANVQQSEGLEYDLAVRSKESADRKLAVPGKAEAPVMLRRAPAPTAAPPKNAPAPTAYKDALKKTQLADDTKLKIEPPGEMVWLADNELTRDGSQTRRPGLAPVPPALATAPRTAAPVRGLQEGLAKSVAEKPQSGAGALLGGARSESLKGAPLALDALALTEQRQTVLRGDLSKQGTAAYNFTQTAPLAASSAPE